MLIIATGIGIFFVVRDKKNKKIEEENKELALLYYRQNTAFGLCGDIGKRYYYHGVEELDMNWLYLELYVYNCVKSNYHLTVDEVLNYLSEEYDADGNLRIYSQPDNIKNYIGWDIHIGQDMTEKFSHCLIDYAKKNGYKQYWEMNIEELDNVLEEYRNSPDYISPLEAYNKSK